MADRITLYLPDVVTRRAKAIADATGRPLEDVLTEWLVRSANDEKEEANSLHQQYSLGSVTGVLSIFDRDGERQVILYDALFDAPVRCYVDDQQLLMALQFDGQRVTVTGRIGRHPTTGIPINVSEITTIAPTSKLPSERFETANGILSVAIPERPEDTVRRLRDEE